MEASVHVSTENGYLCANSTGMLPSLSLLDLQPTLDDIHAFSFKTQIAHGFDPKLLCRKLGGLKGWKNMNQRSARSTHQNQLNRSRQRTQWTYRRHRQNAYLGPMQNSIMHKEKLQREKGSAIVRRIGGAPKLLREALVARESRQTKKRRTSTTL